MYIKALPCDVEPNNIILEYVVFFSWILNEYSVLLSSSISRLLFNYSMFIFLQETQISFDLYAAVICVALKQNKHASELPLLGKNIPKDHDGIFPPVLPTSISVPPIDINLALFPSGNCVIFSIFLDNRLLFYMELLKCHSIFVRFFSGSNKFVDSSIVIFKPPGYFPSSSCHLNCRRYSTLDELLFKSKKFIFNSSIETKSNDNKHIFFLQICRLKSNKIPVIKRKWIIRWFMEKSNNSFVCFSF